MAKIDWAFTEDGDLAAGEPKLDLSGKVLYQHLDGTIDTDKREDGIEIRDIELVYDLDAEKQTIMNRLRTDSPDWYHHPGMGGNLTDLIGEPNTRETGERGSEYIRRALTYKGLYHANQISVRPVPLSPDEIVFMIDISKFGNKVTRLPLVFNLQYGVMNIYQTPKPSQEGV
jgi:phage baseplate assembly protein W